MKKKMVLKYAAGAQPVNDKFSRFLDRRGNEVFILETTIKDFVWKEINIIPPSGDRLFVVEGDFHILADGDEFRNLTTLREICPK